MKIYYDNLEDLELKGVYLIRNLDNKLLKIGICKNLKRRFKEIQNSFNFVGYNSNLKIECFIECDNNLEIEKRLHDKFKDCNYKNEWFNIKDITPLLDEINKYNIKKSNNKNTKVLDISSTKRYYYEIRKEKYIICDCESPEDAVIRFKELTSNYLFANYRSMKFKPYNNDDGINKPCVIFEENQYTYEEFEKITCERYYTAIKNDLNVISKKIENIDLNDINIADKSVLYYSKKLLPELALILKMI